MATKTRKLHANAGAYVLQAGEGQALENLHLRIVATGALTGGTMFAAVCVNPGPGGPPLHTHHAHDEFYLVLAGRYRFKMIEEVHEGGPGTFVYVPRGTPHTFACVGSDEGRIFAGSMPGLEHFLERMSGLQARGAGHEEYVALFRDFQSEINGPSLV
jgi:mannose-6-phosphate isomerase-like protein (cupin superfamily)